LWLKIKGKDFHFNIKPDIPLKLRAVEYEEDSKKRLLEAFSFEVLEDVRNKQAKNLEEAFGRKASVVGMHFAVDNNKRLDLLDSVELHKDDFAEDLNKHYKFIHVIFSFLYCIASTCFISNL
jgi:hypothetical protein